MKILTKDILYNNSPEGIYFYFFEQIYKKIEDQNSDLIYKTENCLKVLHRVASEVLAIDSAVDLEELLMKYPGILRGFTRKSVAFGMIALAYLKLDKLKEARTFSMEALELFPYEVRMDTLEAIKEELYDENSVDDFGLIVRELFEQIKTALEIMSQL